MTDFTFKIRCAGSKEECASVGKKLNGYFVSNIRKYNELYEHECKIDRKSSLEAHRYAHKVRTELLGMISDITYQPS